MSEVPESTLEVPTGLSKAAAKWYRACCRDFRFTTASELEILAQAARSLTRIEECAAAIKRDGVVVRGSKGIVSHPCARLEQQHRAQFLLACRQLGISQPKHVADPDEDDDD